MSRICCPLCGKVVGESSVTGIMKIGDLGYSQVVSEKFDHRKASWVFWSEFKKVGNLCRKCAKEKYPEGYLYKVVTRAKFGGELDCFGGEYGHNFKTIERARSVRDYQSKKIGEKYWIVRKNILTGNREVVE